MFFDDDHDIAIGLNPDLLRIIQHKMYFLAESTDEELADLASSSRSKAVPTHTEDGIPIRKIYVSNLPPKTTRTQLFEVFAQYGFIKSCWLRMGEKGTPTYAFVTFSNPDDAHKALLAPNFEKSLRGRNLRCSPADSWHQPSEDAQGKVVWKQKQGRIEPGGLGDAEPSGSNAGECSTSSAVEDSVDNGQQMQNDDEAQEEDPQYDIMDILNSDCIHHILQYVPIKDLIRAEAVNKRWATMIQEYFFGIRTFKTSWWQHARGPLTTAVLRRVLQRVGRSLTRLHIDHHVSALNDRTAHIVGKFCPQLEELKVVGMHTKNWNPLVYGCKNLKVLSFISCNKLDDSNLVQIIKEESNIEQLTVANNSRVTGLFLTGASPPRLRSLSFYNCFSIQGTVLAAAAAARPALAVLRLDVGPNSLWKMIPAILNQLPQLEELSLSEYMASDSSFVPTQNAQPLLDAFAKLTQLKVLNLSRNIYNTNEVLKTIANTSKDLTHLDISCCNFKRGTVDEGVGDEGVSAICRSCISLQSLNISYLGALSDSGASAVARLPRLRVLTARGMPQVTAAPFAKCLEKCHELEELDVCGCDAVGAPLAAAAPRALQRHPRALQLLLAGTAAAQDETLLLDQRLHPLLSLDVLDDRSNPNLRPDFVDSVYDDDDEEQDDLYDPYFQDHEAHFLDTDDEDIFDAIIDSDDYEYEFELGFNAGDIMLM